MSLCGLCPFISSLYAALKSRHWGCPLLTFPVCSCRGQRQAQSSRGPPSTRAEGRWPERTEERLTPAKRHELTQSAVRPQPAVPRAAPGAERAAEPAVDGAAMPRTPLSCRTPAPSARTLRTRRDVQGAELNPPRSPPSPKRPPAQRRPVPRRNKSA